MILTFGFDAHSFARLAPLRERHFPAAINYIPVHVTLFQQLPEDEIGRILSDLGREAARTAPLRFRATGILDFGKGAAVDIDCPPAREVQSRLRAAWADILTDSDDRARKLHVTVQNKVSREEAKSTQAALRAAFTPWEGVFDRLLLWHYRGGPWESAAEVPLKGETQ